MVVSHPTDVDLHNLVPMATLNINLALVFWLDSKLKILVSMNIQIIRTNTSDSLFIYGERSSTCGLLGLIANAS